MCCGKGEGSYCYKGQTCGEHGGCEGTASLGVGPSFVVNVEGAAESGDHGGDSSSSDDGNESGAQDGDDGDAAVGLRANLALVAVIAVLVML